jgi:AcrR family transcriptional regulator
MAGARGLPSPRARPRQSQASEPAGVNGRRDGHEQVLEIQRRRLLAAAALVAAEQGVAALTVSNVLRRAGMSRRTFYEIFQEREQCLLAVMEEALERVGAPVAAAWRAQEDWLARVRAAVAELLWQLQEDPVAAKLLLVESQAAGRTVLALRQRTVAGLAAALDEGRAVSRVGDQLPAATAEGLVGGLLSILHTRLLSEPAVPLARLAGALTSMLVLPYLGAAAARREFERPAPERQAPAARAGIDGDAGLRVFPARMTHRTARVLLAIGARPGSSNREIGESAGIVDQGQISKLLRRLQGVGLIENDGGSGPGAPNAWRLTVHGERMAGVVRG